MHSRLLASRKEAVPETPPEKPTAPHTHFPAPEFVKEILREDRRRMCAESTSLPPGPVLEINAILHMFSKSLLKKRPPALEEIKEVERGFADLFVFALEKLCLYKCERDHFLAHVLPGGPDSVLRSYGLVHLLRALVAFPKIRDSLDMDAETAEYISEYILLFFSFIEKNLDSLETSLEISLAHT